MSKLVLGDGGLYHRPDHPHVFPPGLRGAAHYLKTVDKVEPKVRKDLAAALANHTFPRDFEGWRGIGLSPKKVMLKLIPGQSERVQRERFEKARPFLKAFRLWVNEYYMWSPFVFDLLYRTLELWDEIDREIVELQNSIRQEEEYAKQWPVTEDDQRVVESERTRLKFLEKEREGWGWWVDFLSSDITVPQLDAWLAGQGICPYSVPGTLLLNMPSSPSNAALWIYERLKLVASETRGVSSLSEHSRQLLVRWDRLHIEIGWEPGVFASDFRLRVEGWQPKEETWAEAEKRFRGGFEQALKNYRRVFEKRLKSGNLLPLLKDSKHVKPHTWEAAHTKYSEEHFRWLALRQVKGLRPEQIVRLPSVEAKISAVHDGIKDAAALLKMELRKVKPGPTPDLDEAVD